MTSYIHQQIEKMISVFSKNAQDLLTVTYREVFQIRNNERTVFYGIAYGKPSKRLARLLTIENELLIVFSAFKEQQFRSISQIRELIDRSGGRLEQTVAIFVHCEKGAENKIKKWGRQKGLSVLPLFYDNEFPTGDVLEGQLIGELFSHDPFDITGPVSDDSQFYGRRTEALDLARKLNAGQIRSYLGIRKIGKTSLLNRSIVEAQKHHAAQCIIVDCSKDSIWGMNASQLMTSIAQAVTLLLESRESQIVITAVGGEYDINRAADELLININKSANSMLLFIDEVDYITPGSPTGGHWKTDFNIFWRNLRAVYQDSCRYEHNFGIFVSGVSSKWFSIESINGIENAALAFVPEEYLSPMPRGASEQMIKILARTSGLQFDESGEAIISEFCSEIPYWIRKACSYIHRQIPTANRPYRIPLSETKALLKQFLDQEGGVLSRVAIMHLLKVYPELQDVCIKIFRNDAKACPQTYLSVLERYGIIKLNPIEISGEMMREGVRLFVDIIEGAVSTEVMFLTDQTNVNLVSDKLIYETYDEWADELAILNRDRNVLEKKLRNVVVNFIRVDTLNNKAKGSVTDRVLKIIESHKRNDFANLSPEQILEKFLWTDLIKIIDKEWQLFERLFGDKNQFQLQGTLVNQRSDAHAKDADRADIAVQRRAVRWYEDKMRLAS